MSSSGRRRQQRYAGALAGFLGVLLVAGLGFALRPAGRREVVQPEPAPAAPDQPQRLLLPHASGTYRAGGGNATLLGGTGRVGELLQDGSLRTYAVTGPRRWESFTVLADGRVVALGPRESTPPPKVTDQRVDLVVVGGDGKVQSQRDVRRAGEHVALAAADDTTAYLWRDAGYFAHDLATGRESLLLPLTGMVDGSVDAADGIATAVAYDRASNPCHPQVVHLTGGSFRQLWSAGVPGCRRVTGLRLSRDGENLAVAYQGQDGVRVALLDTEEGRVFTDRRVGAGSDERIELAWQDDRAVRGVLLPVGGGIHELVPFVVR
ncbi:hypothetical protein AB0J83_09570 [Actinoplanes sp. NPDC049596]|uniref:hypothetical protein n=1 Tax=unclassified Actinoplanes TaxID=2626549 RepID=UPI003446F279